MQQFRHFIKVCVQNEWMGVISIFDFIGFY